MTDVTRILNQIEGGDPSAANELLPLVYDELRKLAAHRLNDEKPGQTLQSTALVHEAYLRLVGSNNEQTWENRGHFFAAAAQAMRRILVESARRKGRQKHGGDHRRNDFRDEGTLTALLNGELLDFDEALARLEVEDPRSAQLVTMRFFAGLTIEQSATALGITSRTAKRDWAFARAWLGRFLKAYDASEN